ncbi:hypothetical protein ABT104_20885 [Streptomyces mobaraensis]|uniref:hypothetical protein n=1 Tax=Streptomyces mobaraensis TaxID=35621 RepID=UPI003330CDC3
MSRNATAVALSLPGARGWDFGDYPYALEPLTLPHPGDPWPLAPQAGPELRETCRELLAAADEGALVTEPVTEEGLERLFWFRWITGHHISFVLWRLVAAALDRLGAGEEEDLATAREIHHHVRAYSAMMLYTGSSTPEIYNAVIRPSMYRLHSTFSGTWAADFPAVRSLFRGRKVPPVPAGEADALMREVALGHRIHLGTAAKLVADGRSLLQHLVDNPPERQPRMWTSVFDCYFLTLRAPVAGQEVLAQLLRRCKAVAMDLTTNGLYPSVAHYPGPAPDELCTPDVLACENELTDIVLRTAALATATSAEPTGTVPTSPRRNG